jgi:ribosome biogenesis GTPase
VAEGRGVVVAVGGGLVAVDHDGVQRVAKLAGRLSLRPVVGDEVGLTLEPDGGARIDVIAERRSTLARAHRLGRGDQTLVANVDVLAIVAACAHPPLRRGLIDRLLVAAWSGSLDAVIVITKLDLRSEAEEAPEAVLADYAGIGYDGVAVATRSADAGPAVAALLGDRIAVLAGHSGVGKSTLVNALTGGAQLTGAVSEVMRGRQTTTAARMLTRTDGVRLVDTPGIRGFGLAGVSVEDLPHAFPELVEAAPGCRYQPCFHLGEPGCAAPGTTSPERLASYRKLHAELVSGASASD